jgi:hypothetical protein
MDRSFRFVPGASFFMPHLIIFSCEAIAALWTSLPVRLLIQLRYLSQQGAHA